MNVTDPQARPQATAGQNASPLADASAATQPSGAGRHRRSRRRWVALGVVAVVAAGAVAAWRAGVLHSYSPASGSGQEGMPAPATAAVTRRDLSATTQVNATLGYAGTYAVSGHGTGTLTWLPAEGQVISQGQALYRTGNGDQVPLLYGGVPDWRNLDEGVTGQDVSQLNHDLVALGDATSSDISALGWDYYSWETKAGVEKLKAHLGETSPSGSLPQGSVVFEPEALRVTQVTGSLGGQESGPVLRATSDRHVVTIPLDASRQDEVKAGDPVTVTLPDGQTAAGTVSSVGTVATTSGSGSAATTTIPVTVTLTRASAAGSVDQAPVTVNLTTSTAHAALVVPVAALLAQSPTAQSPGGYAVEVVGQGNTRRYVPVTPGIFDDSAGLVQVTGALAPGEHVVVPAS